MTFESGNKPFRNTLVRLSALILMGSLPTFAGMAPVESRPHGKLWKVSMAFVAAASAADAQSSLGRYELNPALRGTGGSFGVKGIALKSAITGGSLGIQWLLMRHHPEMDRLADICSLCD